MFVLIISLSISCKNQLDIKNPNSPTFSQANSESGIISFALGSVYTGGFNGVNLSPLNALGDSYFFAAECYHELLADNITSQNANQNYNVVNLPDYVILDDGTKLVNQSPHKTNIRINNTRDKRASNALYYEWAYMYALINGMNNVLSIAPTISFGGDASSRLKTLQAWAYFWKGFAYFRIGSLYYAGLIENSANATNNVYVAHSAIISESNRLLNLAATTLGSITSTSDYTTVLSQLIPSFLQTGNGGVPSVTAYTYNINTLLARNILVNNAQSALQTSDWTAILTLVNAGITSSDPVFTARTSAVNPFMSLTGGSTAASTAGSNSSSNFKITERLIQEYYPGDLRLSENFSSQTYLNTVGGLLSSTRWKLVSGGNSVKPPTGTNSLSFILADNTTLGNYQLTIAGSYEENELMKAEALVETGQIDQGLAPVDNVRKFQGSGLATVSGTGLTQAQALQQIRRERRVALIFKGTAFYDARRWGVIYDISKGGGRTGAVVLSSSGVLSVNATINYDFFDYWDVPADESVINPPGSGSAPILNPN